MREQQLRKEIELLDEKLHNFDALESKLKQAAPSSPKASKLPQPNVPA